jgi:ABC-type antimicrobial peptide transport system permease subunit
VARRTREVGIRLAVGATRTQVTRALLGEVAMLAAGGALAGALAAVPLVPAIRSVLFGFGGNDYALLPGVAALLIVVALAAAWTPARRAAGLDPNVALREG